MDDMQLFDPQAPEKNNAKTIFAEWAQDPDSRPRLRNSRDATVVARIVEALEAGFKEPVIKKALDKCWKFSSKVAWETALNIAFEECRRENKSKGIRLSDTQEALLRLREDRGLLKKP